MSDTNPIFVCSLLVHKKNRAGKPKLEIRAETSEDKKMMELIQSAYHETPIIIYPRFRNKLEALERLQQIGLIRKEKDEQGNDQYFYK